MQATLCVSGGRGLHHGKCCKLWFSMMQMHQATCWKTLEILGELFFFKLHVSNRWWFVNSVKINFCHSNSLSVAVAFSQCQQVISFQILNRELCGCSGLLKKHREQVEDCHCLITESECHPAQKLSLLPYLSMPTRFYTKASHSPMLRRK